MAVHESRRKNWEDLDVTRDELKNLTECLKKDEFRKLLADYAREVTDPDNRKLYETEIKQLERERGVDVTFVNPEPGYVIKTSADGTRKCFINVSKSEHVGRPTSEPRCDDAGHRGLRWSIPHTLAPPRDDLDKKNVRCVVYDVVFHPDTLHLALKDARFREVVNNTAMDGVEGNFKVKLDRKNVKFPKMSYKGIGPPTVLRKKVEKPAEEEPLDIEPEIYQKLMASYDESRKQQFVPQERSERPAPPTTYLKDNKMKPESEKSVYTTPKFVIKHQTDVEIEDFQNHKNAKLHTAMPKKLVVVIELPLLKSAADASLDVQERSLSVKSERPAKYRLELPLPYNVDADNGNAKFDPKYKKLTVTLPVNRGIIPLGDTREDSGVDSDHGSPLAGSGDEADTVPSDGHTLGVSESTSHALGKKTPLITMLSQGSAVSEIDDTALRTSETTVPVIAPFMNPNYKFSLPAYHCNIYDNVLALTVHVKNVDPSTIKHRTLDSDSGIHILLTSVGAGFFPVYYSLCLKIAENAVDRESLTVEPWDNNVVFTLGLKTTEDLSRYHVGLDEEFMEAKDLPTAVSLKNRFDELMIGPKSDSDKKIEVIPEGNDVVINITPNRLDSDDEGERDDTDSSPCEEERKTGPRRQTKSWSVSESSSDELTNGNGSTRRSKGILKSWSHGFSRSVSESSVDDSALLASSVDFHSDSVQEIYSESGGSSLKKTVRFNDVVSRQLYRSNSSILGQRKKNQRKNRNKKRAHDRKTSESENSESDEREKYKFSPNGTPDQTDVHENVKPILNTGKSPDQTDVHENVNQILNTEKSPENKKSANIEIEQPKNNKNAPHKSKRNSETKENDGCLGSDKDNAKDVVRTEFKNDMIFDLDM